MRLLKFSALSVLTFFVLTEFCSANPVVIGPTIDILWGVFWVILVVAPLIEALIIFQITGKRVGESLTRFYWLVFLMNVDTFIATQALAYCIALLARRYMLGSLMLGNLAEILPLVVEFLLLRWMLARLYRGGKLTKPFTNKEVIGMTLLANLITFVGGLVFLLSLTGDQLITF